MDYKATLHLPKTAFPMKANLPKREVEILKVWQESDLYHAIIKRNQQQPRFTLHDGPPYANASIHLGTAMNKVLKDIVVKYRNMKGELSEYLPGWDCHGLPIELQTVKELGKKRAAMSVGQFRQACRRYAERFMEIQRQEFQRLGVLGEWQVPYLTMSPSYQAQIVREFAKVVASGMVFRQKKSVLWCMHCATALAELEVEYHDHTSPSIYVAFPFCRAKADSPLAAYKNLFALIWTTTPWTLISNLAICLNENFDYAVVRCGKNHYLVAEKLVESTMATIAAKSHKVVAVLPAKELEGAVFQHPFIERESPIIFGDHVTLEAGTGCVHTAPGHGQEDYDVGRRYGLEAYAPVDDRGCFTKEAGEFAGQNVFAANSVVINRLKEVAALLGHQSISHSYPHCWRCNHPVIFRATAQWFIGMDKKDLRSKSLKAIEKVEWIPKWGKERMQGMLQARPDWCISRQRSWGVPIVTFACQGCGEFLLDEALILKVADLIEQDADGADFWFAPPKAGETDPLLPPATVCKNCKSSSFQRGQDILDVWFDSGISYAAVIEKRMQLAEPCELYLEGSDQHRGWFHSALLESMATRGRPPYQTVLTHGFVVDGEGRKMSKSLGNYIGALDLINQRGADLLRLWTATEDYQNDVRISEEILQRVTEAYRRIRNTCRFLLGNLHDFDPNTHRLDYPELGEMDRFMLHRLMQLTGHCLQAYEGYAFHQICHRVHNFCVNDLSSFYLDVSKDCLYTNAANSKLRRAIQTVLYETIGHLSRLLAPLISFTAEEIWQHIPGKPEEAKSVFLASMPQVDKSMLDDSLAATWERLLVVRDDVLKVLEVERANKSIGSSLEGCVLLQAESSVAELLGQYSGQLADLFIVSKVELKDKGEGNWVAAANTQGLKIAVVQAKGKKCERCWIIKSDIGKHPDHPTICGRCSESLSG